MKTLVSGKFLLLFAVTIPAWAATPVVNPVINSVVNGASFQATGLAPGGAMVIFGSNLSASTLNCVSAGHAPTVCNNASVLVNGSAVPLIFVSAGEKNFAGRLWITGRRTTL